MKLRIRTKSKSNQQQSSRYSSQIQLPMIKKYKLELPTIRKDIQFMDSYQLSQGYVKINRNINNHHQPTSARTSTQKKTNLPNRYNRYNIEYNSENIPIQDRIQQKIQQNQQRYANIIRYVKWKSKQNRKNKNKSGMQFMYARLQHKSQLSQQKNNKQQF